MSLAENFAEVRSRIAAAARRAGRDPGGVSLVAVSKTHPAAAVDEAIECGQFLFGESKVQEAKAKIPKCSGRAAWHLIGHLQSNKARDAVQLFDLIESVDGLALATELSKRAEQQSKDVRMLLQVNVAGESTKFGYDPDRLVEEFARILSLPRVEVRGLMTIAPYSTDVEKVRPVFRRLRELRDMIQAEHAVELPHLSMGMSGDFEVAIEEGATLVRVGTALFGRRTYAAAEGT